MRPSVSTHANAAACPRCVTSYGVMPHAYTRARSSSSTRWPAITAAGAPPAVWIDVLPAVNGGDSFRAAHAAPRWVPVSPGRASRSPGLTVPPQAFSLSARPAARTFLAALTSRSCTAPHAWHCQVRTLERLGAVLAPHVEQVGEVGVNRPILVERRPYCAGFLADQAQQLGPPGVVNGFGEPGAGEPGHGQVLGVDRLAVADQRAGLSCGMIEAGFADLAVHDRDPPPCFDPVSGAFGLAGQRPLRLG